MTYRSQVLQFARFSSDTMRWLPVQRFDSQHYRLSPGTACKVVAVVTYYSFLSSFSWLLVMAIDVWRTLRMSTLHLRVVSRESRWCVFITYSALCWFIFPGILVSTALGMELLQVESAFWPGLVLVLCLENQSRINKCLASWLSRITEARLHSVRYK